MSVIVNYNTPNIIENFDKLNVYKKRGKWDIKITQFSRHTHNPIRAIVEGLQLEPNPDKQMIALSIGKKI